MKLVPLRLQPGADLHQALEASIGEQPVEAGYVISTVGSLSVAQLRLAGATQATAIQG
jgi:predicted DNA-binding protein with PD1-like motif